MPKSRLPGAIAERLECLRSYGILDTDPEATFDDIAAVAAQVCQTPVSLISLVEADRQWFKARVGFEPCQSPIETSFCAHALSEVDLLVVPDATQDPRFAANQLVVGEPFIRFYAGAVLASAEGVPFGTLCVIDRTPRPDGLAPEQARILCALARSVMRELELRKANRILADQGARLSATMETLNVTLENMDQGLMMVDAGNIVQVANRRLSELLELPREMMAAKPTFDDVREYQRDRGEFAGVDRKLAALVERRTGFMISDYCYERVRPNGVVIEVRTVPLSDGGAVRTFTDITTRKMAEAEVWRVASHDALTGLPNRVLFQQRFDEALASAAETGTSVSLMIIDLDDFKEVNDLLGHYAGDALLKETASRLKQVVRECDMVARLGGDEFAVIAVQPVTMESAIGYGERIAETLRSVFEFEGRSLSTRASIGIAMFPDHHSERDELMKDADIALYQAKEEGRGRVAVYTPAAREAIETRSRVIQEVRDALDGAQFVPFYQPKICLRTGAIVGFEALARWQHPERGPLTPGYFHPAFHDAEIAVRLGERMMRQVAADIRSWLDQGDNPGRVALNLSSAEFADPLLAQHVLGILRAAGVPEKCFEVEVTETVFLGKHTETVQAILRQFEAAGVSIALDDFGTGYASLTHLKEFPVNHIKVDQSFIRNLETNQSDAAIVAAVIGLGKSLGTRVTAEGVETEGQARLLRRMGCDKAQGFLFARPMAGTRVPWLLRNWVFQAARPQQAAG